MQFNQLHVILNLWTDDWIADSYLSFQNAVDILTSWQSCFRQQLDKSRRPSLHIYQRYAAKTPMQYDRWLSWLCRFAGIKEIIILTIILHDFYKEDSQVFIHIDIDIMHACI